MALDKRVPFNQRTDTGRMGFRYEWEPPDERPEIVYREPFWKDEEERLRYERAVAMCPLSQYRHLDVFEYLAEVAKVAEGIKPKGEPVKDMPKVKVL